VAPSLVIALLVAQLGGKTLAIDPSQSKVEFHVDHKLHAVDGRAKSVEAKAVISQDGRVLAMVRVPAASLDSGDANRDSNMRDVLEVGKYPFVIFKGVGELPPALPASAAFELTLKGELDLHGVKRPLDLPLRVEVAQDGSLRARGTTRVSLDAHGIERPSLLLVKIEDGCQIDVDVVLRESKP
jgi:polyisoprenoid-binding protein YceI